MRGAAVQNPPGRCIDCLMQLVLHKEEKDRNEIKRKKQNRDRTSTGTGAIDIWFVHSVSDYSSLLDEFFQVGFRILPGSELYRIGEL